MKILGKQINNFNWKLGRRIVQISNLSNLDGFVTRIKRLPIELNVIFDIGAYDGSYAKLMKRNFPQSRIISFEANPIHSEALDSCGVEKVIVPLFRENTLIPFFATGKTGDSIYRENHSAEYVGLKPLEVPARRLDDVVKERGFPNPSFVKIDVQGAELDVLRGGYETLQKANVITLELSLGNYNLGAPSLNETLEFMLTLGFIPFDFVEQHYARGVLIQIDIAFMRREVMRDCFGEIPRFYE